MGKKLSKEEYLEKLFSTYSNYKEDYDFSEFNYINGSTKAKVICNKHNTSKMQNPRTMLFDGAIPCDKCSKDKSGKIYDTESYLRKLFDRRPEFKERFDYSKTNYTKNACKSTVICKKHNLEFTQELSEHLYKNSVNCPECHKENSRSINNTEDYINEAHKNYPEFKERFDYSKLIIDDFKYRDKDRKGTVICKEHNLEFQQNLVSHIQQGKVNCPECVSRNRSKSSKDKYKKVRLNYKSEWLKEAKRIHGDAYDYRGSYYKGMDKPTTIRCKKHNHKFKLNSSRTHLDKERGMCPLCKYERDFITPEEMFKNSISGFTKDNNGTFGKPFYKERFRIKNKDKKVYTRMYSYKERYELFLYLAEYAFGNKFDYSNIDMSTYENLESEVKIRCREHDEVFETKASRHINNLHGGCEVCFDESASQTEKQLRKSLKEFGLKMSFNNRKIIKGNKNRFKEIDILATTLNLGIEVNGINWHSNIIREDGNDNQYHMLDKMIKLEDKGYKMLGFYDDELLHKHDLCVKEVTRFIEGSYQINDFNPLKLSIKKTSRNKFKNNYIENNLDFFNEECNKFFSILYNKEVIGGFSLNENNICYNYYNKYNMNQDIDIIKNKFPDITFVLKYDSYDRYKILNNNFCQINHERPTACNFVRDENSPISSWIRINKTDLNSNYIYNYGRSVLIPM